MKIILRIAAIALVALIISVGLWMYLNGYLVKSKASNEVATLSFAEPKVVSKGGQTVHGDLTVAAASGISGMDLSFSTEGTNLSFLYAETASHLPAGYELVLDESGMVTNENGLKRLTRVVLVSRKTSTALPKSALIPLYFSVINNGVLAAKSTLTVSIAPTKTQIVGLSQSYTSGTVFALEGKGDSLAYTVELEDPRAASVTNLTCSSTCSRNIILKWTDSANEDGYKIIKDGTQLTTIGKNSAAYPYNWCGNYSPHTFSVIAYNDKGSVSTTEPSITCSCAICPTAAPPTPTPVMPTTSADLIFRLNFPDVDMSVNRIPNVKIMVLGNDGKPVCNDDTNCGQIVSMARIYDSSQTPTTYFSTPQLQYNLTENKAYSIVVKQSHTIQRTYKNVFLVYKTLLNCLVPDPKVNHGCGQLISADLDSRPMYSGDLDGFDGAAPGFNKIDINDLTKVGEVGTAQNALNNKSIEGDVNLDGTTDVKDYGIISKHLNLKGD